MGGGFGGIKAALDLADDERFEVSLISDQTDFRYYPSLYHAAIGGNPLASSIPLKEIFEGKNISMIKDSAKKLARNEKKVYGSSGKTYSYDSLIIALGVVTNFFGIKGLKEHSFGIKSLQQAKSLHDHLHQQLSKGLEELNYIVIGGGATGVELAGVLPSYIKHIAKKHSHPIKKIHVDLVEAAPRLMPNMHPAYSEALQKRLRKLGVKLLLDQAVEAASADHLQVSGHDIKSHTVIWTAGIKNHPFIEDSEFELDKLGKAIVNEYLQAEENVYVIGDNAATPYSGMAQTALHDAMSVTGNLKRLADGQPPKAYRPKKPIYVTPGGPNWAAVQWGNLHIYGRLGWALRKMADLIAYRDVEPWWQAGKHWMASMQTRETCHICADKKT